MTQQDRIDLIEETCAHWSRICMTLFAQWASEERESPALRATLARLRSRASDREKLDKLAALYSPKGTATLPAGFDAANRVYKLFTRHYHHAAPFEARALRVPWERCAGDRRCASKQDLIRNVGVVLPAAGG